MKRAGDHPGVEGRGAVPTLSDLQFARAETRFGERHEAIDRRENLGRRLGNGGAGRQTQGEYQQAGDAESSTRRHWVSDDRTGRPRGRYAGIVRDQRAPFSQARTRPSSRRVSRRGSVRGKELETRPCFRRAAGLRERDAQREDLAVLA